MALNTNVTTVAGHEYLLTMTDPSVTWTTVMRYVTTNPARAGFQNQSQTLLFQLANVDWTQGLRELGWDDNHRQRRRDERLHGCGQVLT